MADAPGMMTVSSDMPASPSSPIVPQQAAADAGAPVVDTNAAPAVNDGQPEGQAKPDPGNTGEPGQDDTPPWLKREVTKARNRQRAAEDEARRLREQNDQLIRRLTNEAPEKPKADARPNRADFLDPDEYEDALVEWAADNAVKRVEKTLDTRTQEQRQSEQARQLQSSWQEKVAAAAKVHPDFEEVVYSDDLVISPAMTEALVSDPKGAEIAYYLGSNLEEAERIAALSPRQQLVEIGKLSVKIEGQQAETTKAPTPIKPLGAQAPAVKKSADQETESEYFARRTSEAKARGEKLYN